MAAYTVKAGDTISKIARDELGEMARWQEIASLNNISTPFTIFPGQVLQLPDISPFRTADVTGPRTVAQIMPTPTRGALARLNWPLLLAILAIGGGLLWFGFRKNA